ncbi:MAG: HD domain-containing protein [Promethearchaeota archaeon]
MWREKLIDFVKDFQHPAWGISHFKRTHELAVKLAKIKNIQIDQDALFAAAYLHDMSAFEPYRKKNIDHADTAADCCKDVLISIGFPSEKISLVKDIIRSHMYYAKPSNLIESILFRDADILDFMGMVGITRILSIVGKDSMAPDLRAAINILKNFQKTLLQKLSTEQAKEIGIKRKEEMKEFLDALSEETNKFKLL